MERWNQADMDVSGRILASLMRAVHAGMTKLSVFILCGAQIMNHFVVKISPAYSP